MSAFEKALRMVCDDLERIAPETPSLHFARGVLAAGETAPVVLVGQQGLPAQEIIEKYRNGMGGPELGREYGCSSETIYRLLMRFGINGKGRPRGPRSTAATYADEAARLYQSGLSIEECAAQLGISTPTVSKALALAGVDKRSANQPRSSAAVKVAQERIDTIMAMRAEGKTLEQIGHALGVTRERIRQVVVKAGKMAEFAERPLTPEERAAAEEYRNGQSLDFVAAQLNVCAPTARRVIERAGIAIRPSKRGKPIADAIAQPIAERYLSGAKVTDIATEFGLKKPEQIYRYLAAAGIKPTRQPGSGRIATPVHG